MFELSRHIVILLLNNDCVIVPNFGGFLTHYVSARYEEKEQLFLPPLRTIGFNPQLKLNDHLLVQSYVETYDISYPEALRRIEGEVEEMKQHLMNEGCFELNDLGVLRVNEDGNYEFTPCEAGILTPELYGFGSFEVKPLLPVVHPKPSPVVEMDVEDEATVEAEDEDEVITDDSADDEGGNAIVVKMSWIRNIVATAVAVLLFFFISTPIDNSESPAIQQSSMVAMSMAEEVAEQPAAVEQQETVLPADSVNQQDSIQQAVSPAEEALPYTICLASQTTRYHAEHFVKNMQERGVSDVRIMNMNNTDRVRIVCGAYRSEQEAHDSLRMYRLLQEGFGEAWVLHVQ